MALAKVIAIDSKRAPKACEWKIRYVHYTKEGEYTYECLVFNYPTGLTAFEAWEVSAFPSNPPFYECTFEPLCDYPCPELAKELKHHGKPHGTNGTRTERARAVLIRQDNRPVTEVSHPA